MTTRPPGPYRQGWADTILDVLQENWDGVPLPALRGGKRGRSIDAVAKARRIAVHLMVDVLDLSLHQATDVIGMSIFGVREGQRQHARWHALARPEAAECDGWAATFRAAIGDQLELWSLSHILAGVPVRWPVEVPPCFDDLLPPSPRPSRLVAGHRRRASSRLSRNKAAARRNEARFRLTRSGFEAKLSV